MAKYTGIVGSRQSQPGNMQPGAGRASGDNLQSVTDNVSINSIIFAGETLVNDSATVASTVTSVRDTPRLLSDSVTVGDTIIFTVPPRARVTQMVTEYFYQGIPDARLTQAVVEYFYANSSTTRLTQAVVEYFYKLQPPPVVDTVTVASTVIEHRDRAIHVTDNVTVGPYLGNIRLLTVSDLVIVNDTPFGRNNNVRISIADSIMTSAPTTEKNQFGITDTVRTADTITNINDGVHITITDTVTCLTVYPNPIQLNVNPVRLSLIHFVTTADTVGGGSPDRFDTVVDSITVADLIRKSPINQAVSDHVTITTILIGGNPRTLEALTDSIITSDFAASRNNNNRHPIIDTLFVIPSLTSSVGGLNTFQAVIDNVQTTYSLTTNSHAPQELDDGIITNDVIGVRAPNNRQAVSDSITVSPGLHWSPLEMAVTDSVTTSTRISNYDQGLSTRVTVTDQVNRRYSEVITDVLNFAEALNGPHNLSICLVDTFDLDETIATQAIYYRTIIDTLVFANGDYQKPLSFGGSGTGSGQGNGGSGPGTGPGNPSGSGTIINVPVVVGTLVTNTTTLQTSNGVILLPVAQFGNELDNVATTTVQQSMNAMTIVFKQSSLRQRLKYTFRLDGIKAWELRTFLIANLSLLITLTTWDAEVWAVVLTSNPFEIQNAGFGGNAGKKGGPNEYSTVQLEFEGTKLSG